MKIFFITILFIGVFCFINQASALWTYEQDFNALNDGDLTTQDGWDYGNGNNEEFFDVTTDADARYEGAKGVKNAGTSSFVFRDITDISAGSVYIALRQSENNDGFVRFYLNSSESQIMQVLLSNDGHIEYHDGVTPYVEVDTYNADQWYVINIEFDDAAQNDKYRIRWHDGASWSEFTSWNTTIEGYTSITDIKLASDERTASIGYFDIISPDDPVVVEEDIIISPDQIRSWLD